MHQLLRDLHMPFSLLLNTQKDTHLNAYHLVEEPSVPVMCVTLHRPARNLKIMLQKKGIPTDHFQFIDTVSLRATTQHPDQDTTYLWNHDLTRLGQTLLTKGSQIQGPKHVVFDAVSTLRYQYDQPTINRFIHQLQQRLPNIHANGIFLNEEYKPWIPNLQFTKVIEL